MGKHYKNAKDQFTQELNELIAGKASWSKLFENERFSDDLFALCGELLDYNFSTQKFLDGNNIKFPIEDANIKEFSEKMRVLMTEYEIEDKNEFLKIIQSIHSLAKDCKDKRQHNVSCEGNPPKAYFNLDKLPDEFWTAIREEI